MSYEELAESLSSDIVDAIADKLEEIEDQIADIISDNISDSVSNEFNEIENTQSGKNEKTFIIVNRDWTRSIKCTGEFFVLQRTMNGEKDMWCLDAEDFHHNWQTIDYWKEKEKACEALRNAALSYAGGSAVYFIV